MSAAIPAAMDLEHGMQVDRRPVDLRWSVVRNVVLAGLLGLLLMIAIVGARTAEAVMNANAAAADALGRHIEVRLLPFQVDARSSAPLPDWDGIVGAVLVPGQCARFVDKAAATVQSVCLGSGPGSGEPPRWFRLAVGWLLGDLPTSERSILNGEKGLGTVVVSTSQAAVSSQLWREQSQLAFLTGISTLVMSLLVYVAIDRALRPAQSVLDGLNRVADGDLTARLPGFGLIELQRIGDVFNAMVGRLDGATRERAALAMRLVDAEEETRRHIARELHDDLAQRLSALGAMAGSIAAAAGDDRPELVAETRALAGTVSDTMRALRATLNGLRPIELDDLGLPASLEALVQDCNQRAAGRTSFSLRIEAPLERLSSTAAGHVYRIVQEGLTNAMRHANAHDVAVAITTGTGARSAAGQVLELAVVDDGDASADATPADHAGWGLIGIRERALALGGSAELKLAPGGGHALSVTIPIELEKEPV